MSTLPNKDTGVTEQIVQIGLKHHCLGCAADGVFCPTYEELPAKRRGARDSLAEPIQALINSEADRRYRQGVLKVRDEMNDELSRVRGGLEFTDEFMTGYEAAQADCRIIVQELIPLTQSGGTENGNR